MKHDHYQDELKAKTNKNNNKIFDGYILSGENLMKLN